MGGILCFIGAIILGVYAVRKAKPYYDRAHGYDLSKIDDVEIPSVILDAKGRELGRMYVENRSVISIDQIPATLVNCLISQEDQRFWKNRGVDWVGLVRMVYLNTKAGSVTQGASTITMQLARNAFNLKSEALAKGEGGVERKIVEIFLAHRIGTKYSSESGKKFILENYLNRVPFGHGYYGVRSAALGYFGKEPMQLSLEECASMVACIKNPSAISPLRYPKTNKKARDHVFKRLLAEELITEAEYNNLVQLPIVTNPKPLKRGTSHLYEKIGDLARQIVGEEAMSTGGYRIYTTIDMDVQQLAENAVRKKLQDVEEHEQYDHALYKDFDPKKGPPEYLQGGMLVNDPATGKVIAHVGGRNYNHNQFDFINSGKRPIGTAALPFLYALGIDQGLNLSTPLLDEQIDNRLVMVGGREGILGEWGPESLTPKYEGTISYRHALANSKIAASIRLGKKLGVKPFADYMRTFGLKFPNNDDLLARDLLGWSPASISEMAQAYSAFANQGKIPQKLYYIEKIESADGLLVHLTSQKEKVENIKTVMNKPTTFLIDNVLRSTIEEGGNLADVAQELTETGFQGGVKTGTPYNFADAWCVAYNDHYVCSTWVGYQQGSQGAILPNGFAKNIAFPVVAEFFSHIPAHKRGSLPKRPEDIKQCDICSTSGQIATRYCFTEQKKDDGMGGDEITYHPTTVREFYQTGSEPTEICSFHMGVNGVNVNDQYGPVSGVTAARPILSINPVKPSSPVVVGLDPYGAVENSTEQKDTQALTGAYASGLLILSDDVPGEEEAEIVLPKPLKLKLKVTPEDLKPQISKAIIVK